MSLVVLGFMNEKLNSITTDDGLRDRTKTEAAPLAA
jgi:hypothetical protein